MEPISKKKYIKNVVKKSKLDKDGLINQMCVKLKVISWPVKCQKLSWNTHQLFVLNKAIKIG